MRTILGFAANSGSSIPSSVPSLNIDNSLSFSLFESDVLSTGWLAGQATWNRYGTSSFSLGWNGRSDEYIYIDGDSDFIQLHRDSGNSQVRIYDGWIFMGDYYNRVNGLYNVLWSNGMEIGDDNATYFYIDQYSREFFLGDGQTQTGLDIIMGNGGQHNTIKLKINNQNMLFFDGNSYQYYFGDTSTAWMQSDSTNQKLSFWTDYGGEIANVNQYNFNTKYARTTSYVIVNGDNYYCSGTVETVYFINVNTQYTCTLPSNPTDGLLITIKVDNTGDSSNSIMVDGNNIPIELNESTLFLIQPNIAKPRQSACVTFQYIGQLNVWIVKNAYNTQ